MQCGDPRCRGDRRIAGRLDDGESEPYRGGTTLRCAHIVARIDRSCFQRRIARYRNRRARAHQYGARSAASLRCAGRVASAVSDGGFRPLQQHRAVRPHRAGMALVVQGLGRKLTQRCRLMPAAPVIPEDFSADSGAPSLPPRPYPGLRPFEPKEDAIFFGREPMIDEIIDLLAQRCLILVHGSSGSGKSSLVLAGVLPRLFRQHRRHGWRWRTASMRPGGGPLWNLARALAELEGGTPSPARVDELRLSFDRTGANLAGIVTHLAGMQRGRLCLLVDQFEELFRYARETSREE